MKEIMEFLRQWCIAKGRGGEDNDIYDTLRELATDGDYIAYKKVVDVYRHWNDVFVVVRIEDRYIGFRTANTTGDAIPFDKGWEFDPSTIAEYVPKEITTTIYLKK